MSTRRLRIARLWNVLFVVTIGTAVLLCAVMITCPWWVPYFL